MQIVKDRGSSIYFVGNGMSCVVFEEEEMSKIEIAELSMHLHVQERDGVFTHTCTQKSSEAVRSNSTLSLVLPHFIEISRHFQEFNQSDSFPGVSLQQQQWEFDYFSFGLT